MTGTDFGRPCCTDRKSSLVALREALSHLESLFETIGESYKRDLDTGEYERVKVVGPSEEELREMVRRGEEIKEEKKRQEGKAKESKGEETSVA